MSLSRTIIDWFVVLLILLFLPKDNRLMFDVKPEEWYGEVRIPLANRTYVIAKNASDSSVELGITPTSRLIVLQEGRSYGVELPAGGRALPRSLVLAEVASGAKPTEYLLDGDDYFHPGRLSILTQADLYNSYLLVALLLGAAMVLGFMIARLGVEEDFELPGTT